ncbi:hypothetical protein [Streptomyces mirabilis]|uniref:hypothetical protein n=1 Tax=Streptomyces mirabilis TaxID=68239 RepID=UPI0036DA5086
MIREVIGGRVAGGGGAEGLGGVHGRGHDEREQISELEAVPDILDRLRRGLTARLDDASDRLGQPDGDGTPTESADLTCRRLRRDLITVEEAELQRLPRN